MNAPVRSVRFAALATLATALVAATGLSGCSSSKDPAALAQRGVMDRLTPYKVEIRQGNVVTREQLALIKPGTPREEVREILGSPMLTDVFHASRWDFMFSTSRGAQTLERRPVTVFFEGDKVSRIEAPELPTENEFVASISSRAPLLLKEPVLELTPEQKAKLPAPVRTEAAAVAQPQGAVRNYPALEKP